MIGMDTWALCEQHGINTMIAFRGCALYDVPQIPRPRRPIQHLAQIARPRESEGSSHRGRDAVRWAPSCRNRRRVGLHGAVGRVGRLCIKDADSSPVSLIMSSTPQQ
jgi:hypothetical protein